MRNSCLPLVLGCALGLSAGAAFAQTTFYSTSFEDPTFSLGDLDGQDGWLVDEGSASVVDGPLAAADGSQYVAQESNSVISRSVSANGANVVRFEGSYQGTGSDVLVVPDVDEPVAVLLGFRRVDDDTFTIAAYDGVAEDYVEPDPAVNFPNDAWANIVAVIDYSAGTYNLSVNGSAYLSDVNFADSNASSLGGFKSLSASASNIDQIGFFEDGTPGIPGDLNNDGCVDVQDFFELLDNWGSPYDVQDFFDVLDNWGMGCP